MERKFFIALQCMIDFDFNNTKHLVIEFKVGIFLIFWRCSITKLVSVSTTAVPSFTIPSDVARTSWICEYRSKAILSIFTYNLYLPRSSVIWHRFSSERKYVSLMRAPGLVRRRHSRILRLQHMFWRSADLLNRVFHGNRRAMHR